MKGLLKKIANKLGYTISGNRYKLRSFLENKGILKLDFDHVLSRALLAKPSPDTFSFIQVGAFDGVQCDPLRKYLSCYNWTGLLLEPQPVPFTSLQELYEGRDGIQLVNAAVGAQPGNAILYTLEGETLPNWSKGMASFSRENILKHRHLIAGLETHICETPVPLVTFDSLLERLKSPPDLIQLDTEGFDAQLIHMYPFHRGKPLIIHFESKHIPKAELEELLDYLIGLGYEVAHDGEEDMMAVLPSR